MRVCPRTLPLKIDQVQNSTEGEDEETKSMRELVQEIDSHAVLIDLEITRDPNAVQSAVQ